MKKKGEDKEGHEGALFFCFETATPLPPSRSGIAGFPAPGPARAPAAVGPRATSDRLGASRVAGCLFTYRALRSITCRCHASTLIRRYHLQWHVILYVHACIQSIMTNNDFFFRQKLNPKPMSQNAVAMFMLSFLPSSVSFPPCAPCAPD